MGHPMGKVHEVSCEKPSLMDKSRKGIASVRVCHVAMGDLWAGAEVQLLALMTYLVRLGEFECSVILFNEGRLARELRKLPLSVSVISEKHHSPIGIAYRLATIFRETRPDIVHTHKYKDAILATIAARCVGVRCVIRVIHGMPEPFKGLSNVNMAIYTMVDRFVTSWLVDKVVAVSADIEKALVRIYRENRVVRIHNGIDLEVVQVRTQRSEKRKEWHFDDTVTLIGTVGRLVPVKGHTVLLEALRILRQSDRTVMLLVVGDGPLRGHLESEVKRLGLEGFVRFAGHQAESYDFINMLDMFVLPSLHEGIPMVLLEALALKKAVIASRVGGIPEVVLHGQTGMLVSPANADELAAGISAIIEDREMALALGLAGRRLVESDFSASMMVDRVAGMYRSLGKTMTVGSISLER